jgi:hypothetical protein
MSLIPARLTFLISHHARNAMCASLHKLIRTCFSDHASPVATFAEFDHSVTYCTARCSLSVITFAAHYPAVGALRAFRGF